MRIFLVLNGSGNFSVPGSKTWIKNLYEPLLDNGHEVMFVDLEYLSIVWKIKFRTKNFKNKLSEFLPELFMNENQKKAFDLIFCYLTDLDIDKAAIGRLKNQNLPLINFSCNNTHQFYLVEKIAPYFDYNLHSEKDAGEKFRKVGANPIWFQMSANPKYYYPIKTTKKFNISFIGSDYAKRGFYIEYLLSKGLEIHAFGPNWLINRPYPELKNLFREMKRLSQLTRLMITIDPVNRFNITSSLNELHLQQILRKKYSDFMHYPLQDNLLNITYNQSRINLGFQQVIVREGVNTPTVQKHLHLREFEIPMSGGLYITDYSDELAEHYLPDQEVLTFRDEYELYDKCRFYLSNPEKAMKISLAGYQRALKSHTCQYRLQNLFAELNL